jgi:hypothetical protein
LAEIGLGIRAVNEIYWLGGLPAPISGEAPLLELPTGAAQAHFVVHSLSHRLLSGERALFALGETNAAGSLCFLLGGPSIVGRLNLLPRYRLHPAPVLPTALGAAAAAAEEFRLALVPPPEAEEPTPPDEPPGLSGQHAPLIISPAAPPPPPPVPIPPQVSRLLCEGEDAGLFPDAYRLPGLDGLPGLATLLRALAFDQPVGAWLSPLARGSLLTLAEWV